MKKPTGLSKISHHILLFVFLAMWVPTAWSLDLPEVLVTAPPVTPGTVIIEPKAIQEAPGAGIANLLAWSGEVDVERKGETQADLSMKASTFEDTGLTVDGFPINDPQTGHFNFDTLLPTENLGAVEISSVPWGSRGLVGSINLVPAIPSAANASLSSSFGSFNTTRSSVELGLPSASVWGGYSHSDGYREDTDSLVQNAGALASLNDPIHSRLMFSFTDRKFGANDFYGHYPGLDEWEATQTTLATWRGDWDGPLGRVEPGLYWRHHTDHFELDRNDPSLYENFHTTDVGGMDTRWSYGHLQGELFGKGEWLKSSSLGLRNRASAGASGLWKESFGSAGLECTALGEGRYEVSPILTAEAHLNDAVRLDLSASRSYREASFTELYYTDPQDIGNAHLSPENAWDFRVSPQWTDGQWFAKANGFIRAERDLIDWVRTDATQPWQSVNIGQAVAKGAGTRFGWNISTFHLQAGYDYLYRDADLGGLQSKYALDYPRQKAVLQGYGEVGRFGGSIGWSRCLRTDKQLYSLLEGKVSFRMKHGSLYVSVLNALDADYQEVGGVPMPGRSFEGGASVTF